VVRSTYYNEASCFGTYVFHSKLPRYSPFNNEITYVKPKNKWENHKKVKFYTPNPHEITNTHRQRRL